MVQSPTLRTPVKRLIQLTVYSGTMMKSFADENKDLPVFAGQIEAAAQQLATAQDRYSNGVLDSIRVRADLEAADLKADRGLRTTGALLEVKEGKRGRLAASVFPEGVSAVTRLYGQSQIDAMVAVEKRLENIKDQWDQAIAQRDKLATLRKNYEAALQARRDKRLEVGGLRAKRDLEREEFVDLYRRIVLKVQAAHRHDKRFVEVLFDRVSSSASEELDDSGPDEPDPPRTSPRGPDSIARPS